MEMSKLTEQLDSFTGYFEFRQIRHIFVGLFLAVISFAQMQAISSVHIGWDVIMLDMFIHFSIGIVASIGASVVTGLLEEGLYGG